MPFFTTLDTNAISREIGSARAHVVLVAPGIATAVADALISAMGRLGPDQVRVVLDVSASVARLGFGDHQAVEKLNAAGLEIRVHPGLRIGVLICDDHGWSFAGTPRLVEADPQTASEAFNAIVLTQAQVIALRAELAAVGSNRQLEPDLLSAGAVSVGAKALTAESLGKVTHALKIAPPKPFDLARRTNVYAALIQFVELHLEGFNIQSRRIQLPKSLPLIASKDKVLRERLTASLKLLDKLEKPEALATVTNELEELREGFLRPVGRAGRVILRAKRPVFEEKLKKLDDRLTQCRVALVQDLQKALDDMVDTVAPELARAVIVDPPARFVGQYDETEEGARNYVRDVLGKALPKASTLVQGMKIHCLFKDVTYEMLTDDPFREAVLSQIPKSVLDGALLTEEEMAAPGAEQGALLHRDDGTEP